MAGSLCFYGLYGQNNIFFYKICFIPLSTPTPRRRRRRRDVIVIKTFLNPQGHQNRVIGLKVNQILLKGEFCPMVELHREGSAINGARLPRLVFLNTRFINKTIFNQGENHLQYIKLSS